MIIFLGDEDGYEDIIESSKDDRDIVVSCQYRHKVPLSLIDKYDCVNIHYGVLPFYAGCNPIYWQIMNGDSAGFTIHYMDENFDSGDIIKTWSLPISSLTADRIYDAIKYTACKYFKKMYPSIIDGTVIRTKQDRKMRKYYSKDMVDFEDTTCNISDHKKIRAMHFEGKQKPKIKIDGLDYEISRCNSGL